YPCPTEDARKLRVASTSPPRNGNPIRPQPLKRSSSPGSRRALRSASITASRGPVIDDSPMPWWPPDLRPTRSWRGHGAPRRDLRHTAPVLSRLPERQRRLPDVAALVHRDIRHP